MTLHCSGGSGNKFVTTHMYLKNFAKCKFNRVACNVHTERIVYSFMEVIIMRNALVILGKIEGYKTKRHTIFV